MTASKRENNVSKLVSMRLPKALLAELAERAKEVGLPYQTVVRALLTLDMERWASGDGPSLEDLIRAGAGHRGGRPKVDGSPAASPDPASGGADVEVEASPAALGGVEVDPGVGEPEDTDVEEVGVVLPPPVPAVATGRGRRDRGSGPSLPMDLVAPVGVGSKRGPADDEDLAAFLDAVGSEDG